MIKKEVKDIPKCKRSVEKGCEKLFLNDRHHVMLSILIVMDSRLGSSINLKCWPQKSHNQKREKLIVSVHLIFSFTNSN